MGSATFSKYLRKCNILSEEAWYFVWRAMPFFFKYFKRVTENADKTSTMLRS
jgi:hypothetical protein